MRRGQTNDDVLTMKTKKKKKKMKSPNQRLNETITVERKRPIGALPRKNIEHWWVGWMARA